MLLLLVPLWREEKVLNGARLCTVGVVLEGDRREAKWKLLRTRTRRTCVTNQLVLLPRLDHCKS